MKAEWGGHNSGVDGKKTMITFNKHQREGTHLDHFQTRTIGARIIYEPAL